MRANGVDSNRIAMLVAVLYRHGGINLLANDLYISTIAGGQAREPGCDLAIVARVGERCEIETDSPHDVRDRRDFVDRTGASGAETGISAS